MADIEPWYKYPSLAYDMSTIVDVYGTNWVRYMANITFIWLQLEDLKPRGHVGPSVGRMSLTIQAISADRKH